MKSVNEMGNGIFGRTRCLQKAQWRTKLLPSHCFLSLTGAYISQNVLDEVVLIFEKQSRLTNNVLQIIASHGRRATFCNLFINKILSIIAV